MLSTKWIALFELFDDRIEITNSGVLVSAISPESFGSKSHSRNPLICGLFEHIDMVEQVGFGINMDYARAL